MSLTAFLTNFNSSQPPQTSKKYHVSAIVVHGVSTIILAFGRKGLKAENNSLVAKDLEHLIWINVMTGKKTRPASST